MPLPTPECCRVPGIQKISAKQLVYQVYNPYTLFRLWDCVVGQKQNVYVYPNKDSFGMLGAVRYARNNRCILRVHPDDFWRVLVTKVSIHLKICRELRECCMTNEKYDSIWAGRRMKTQVITQRCFFKNEDYLYPVWEYDGMNLEDLSVTDVHKFIRKRFVQRGTANIPLCPICRRLTDFMYVPEQYLKVKSSFVRGLNPPIKDIPLHNKKGIRGVQMIGTEGDWKRLLHRARTLIKHVEHYNKTWLLSCHWVQNDEKVFKNLLRTYQGKDTSIWWGRILHPDKRPEGKRPKRPFWGPFKYLRSWRIPRRRHIAGGWFWNFLTYGHKHVRICQGLGVYPLTIWLQGRQNHGLLYRARLLAGLAGFNVFKNTKGAGKVIQANHTWAIMVENFAHIHPRRARKARPKKRVVFQKPKRSKRRFKKRKPERIANRVVTKAPAPIGSARKSPPKITLKDMAGKLRANSARTTTTDEYYEYPGYSGLYPKRRKSGLRRRIKKKFNRGNRGRKGGKKKR